MREETNKSDQRETPHRDAMLEELIRRNMEHVLDQVLEHLAADDILRLSWTSASLRVYAAKIMGKERFAVLDFERGVKKDLGPVFFKVRGTNMKTSGPLVFGHDLAPKIKETPPREREIKASLVDKTLDFALVHTLRLPDGSLVSDTNTIRSGGYILGLFQSNGGSGVSLLSFNATSRTLAWETKIADSEASPAKRTLCVSGGFVYAATAVDYPDSFLFTLVTIIKLSERDGSRVCDKTEKLIHPVARISILVVGWKLYLVDSFSQSANITTFFSGDLRNHDLSFAVHLQLPHEEEDFAGPCIVDSFFMGQFLSIIMQVNTGVEFHVIDTKGETLFLRYFHSVRYIAHSPDGGVYLEDVWQSFTFDDEEDKEGEDTTIYYGCAVRSLQNLKTLEDGVASEVFYPDFDF